MPGTNQPVGHFWWLCAGRIERYVHGFLQVRSQINVCRGVRLRAAQPRGLLLIEGYYLADRHQNKNGAPRAQETVADLDRCPAQRDQRRREADREPADEPADDDYRPRFG